MQESPSTPSRTPATEQLVGAWWGLAQAMRHRVAPMLEREHGVDLKDYAALRAIQEGANYPRLMCERLAMNASAISRAVDDLARRDLITRQIDPEDSRRVRLAITPNGERILQATRATMLSLFDEALVDLPHSQIEEFTRTLRQLTDHLTRASDAPTPAASAPAPEQEA